jgi:iron complex outermembrane receptor protein
MFRCNPIRRRSLLFLVLVFAAGATARIAAQATHVLEGVVKDPSGAAVAGARIEARGPGAPRMAVTDAEGRFRINGLATGRYTVRAELYGFMPAANTVELTGPTAALDLTLGPVVSTESVTVTASTSGHQFDVPAPGASRLGLTPRETPATLDVVTFAESNERGLRNAIEALTSVPAVSSANLPSAPGTATIRGFAGPAVSQLFDGTRVTTSTMVNRNYDTWTFDRIEVLKGPASVLYGEGALAGVINFVPKRPDFRLRRSEALIAYGGLNTTRLAMGTTGPVGARAAYRADLAWNSSDGYRIDGGSNMLTLNGALDVKLGTTAVWGIAADYFRDDDGAANFGAPIVPASAARRPSTLVTDSRGWVLDEAIREVNYDVAGAVTDIRAAWLRSRLDWQLSPAWRLTNDFYLYDKAGTWNNAEVYTFVPATGLVSRSTVSIEHDMRFYGNRVALGHDGRVASRRNRFTAGADVNTNDFFSPRRFGATTAVDLFDPDRGTFPADSAANFPGAGNRTDFTTTVTQASVFAEDALSLMPRVTVVGGVRYDRVDVGRRVVDLNAGTTSTFAREFNAVSGRGGVVFDLTPRTQIFGQATSAVAPVATILLISAGNLAFDLTTGWSAEAGVKSTLARGHVDVTAAVFKIQQDDIVTRDPNNFNISIQGGTQASTGFEIAVAADVTEHLRVDANAAIMDARFVRLLEAGGANRAGNVPPNVPERTARLWAWYRLPDTPLRIGVGVRYQGRFFTNNANSTEAAGFTLVDAQASWSVGSGEVTLRGRNLTDTLYADWTGASASQLLLGAPRTVDLSYHVRF